MKYEFNKSMKELSGFGQDYEQTCRTMVTAGLEYWDANPDLKPAFSGYKNIIGLVKHTNKDGEALIAHMSKAVNDNTTGAMMQLVIGTILWIREYGWDDFVTAMTHPEGELGIVKDRLKETEQALFNLGYRRDALYDEINRRGMIIATQILGWQSYEISSGQYVYAPNAKLADQIPLGSKLSYYVDEAISKMMIMR